jgi:hypothetical protein
MALEELDPFDWRRAQVGTRHEPVTGEMLIEVDEGRACLSMYAAGVAAYIKNATLFDVTPLDGQGFLYAIQFGWSVVKVGQTIKPRHCLLQHHRDANAFATTITQFWVSPAHWHYLDNETALIEYCAEVSYRARREYFHDIGIGYAAIHGAELAHRSMLQEVNA